MNTAAGPGVLEDFNVRDKWERFRSNMMCVYGPYIPMFLCLNNEWGQNALTLSQYSPNAPQPSAKKKGLQCNPSVCLCIVNVRPLRVSTDRLRLLF